MRFGFGGLLIREESGNGPPDSRQVSKLQLGLIVTLGWPQRHTISQLHHYETQSIWEIAMLSKRGFMKRAQPGSGEFHVFLLSFPYIPINIEGTHMNQMLNPGSVWPEIFHNLYSCMPLPPVPSEWSAITVQVSFDLSISSFYQHIIKYYVYDSFRFYTIIWPIRDSILI